MQTIIKKNWILILILILGAMLRWINLGESMSFFYDQARDLLAAKAILGGDFVLVGPTTDMPGIFFGPLWFYLLAILSFLFSGSPILMTLTISFLDLLTIVTIYIVGTEIFNRKTGVISAFLWAICALPVAYARTLASPSTTAVWALLCVYCLLKIAKGRQFYLVPAAVFLGIMFQLNPASSFFFLFFVAAAVLFSKRKINSLWTFISLLMFLGMFAPQILFEIRNSFPATHSIGKIFLSSEHTNNYLSNLISRWHNLELELSDYTFYSQKLTSIIILLFTFFFAITKGLFVKKIFLLYLVVPITIFLFLYPRAEAHPHYLLSWIPGVIILLAYSISKLRYLGFVAIIALLYLNSFGLTKEIFLKDHLAQPADPNLIGLNDQIRVIDYLYEHAKAKNFGYYSYNVTPYWADQNFQYLFPWYGQKKYGYLPTRNTGENIFVIYEPEPYLGQAFQDKWLTQFHSSVWQSLSKIKLGPYTVEEIQRIRPS